MAAGIKIYTSPFSFNGLRPELVLAEKGLTNWQAVPADLATNSHKTPDFLNKAHFGHVPLMEDTEIDTSVCESRAIARYLAAKFKGTGIDLEPQFADSPKKYSIFEQGLSIETQKYDAYVSPLIYLKVLAPFLGHSIDENRIKYNLEKLLSNLDVINNFLSKHEYMGGDSYSLVDINFMPTMHMLHTYVDKSIVSSRPTLQRWWANVSARPAWKKVVVPLDECYMNVVMPKINTH